MKLPVSIATAAIALVAATPALAQDTGLSKGDVIVRLRGILVAPNESSGGIQPSLPTEKVRVDDSFMPEVDLTYMLTDAVGVEVIASTTKHSVFGITGVTGGIGKLASTWVLPPTATVNYHFNNKGAIRPYLGAGVNWTIFWNSKPTAAFEAAAGKTHVGMSDSVGVAAQAGVDIDLGPKMFLNLDVKYITIKTDATLVTAGLGTQKVHVALDPLVFGAGVGFKF